MVEGDEVEQDEDDLVNYSNGGVNKSVFLVANECNLVGGFGDEEEEDEGYLVGLMLDAEIGVGDEIWFKNIKYGMLFERKKSADCDEDVGGFAVEMNADVENIDMDNNNVGVVFEDESDMRQQDEVGDEEEQ